MSRLYFGTFFWKILRARVIPFKLGESTPEPECWQHAAIVPHNGKGSNNPEEETIASPHPTPLNRGISWNVTLNSVLTPYLDALDPKTRRHWAPHYLRCLLLEAERKSVQLVATEVAPDDYDQLHHFVAASPWSPAPLERLLARDAQRLVGGEHAALIVDNTTLLNAGRHSVGVARQYSGAVGDVTTCQKPVSVTPAKNEVTIPVALRLFLPDAWTRDPARCERAGVPPERLAPLTKNRIAIAEIDRLLAAGVNFKVVLADAEYGHGRSFGRALSARGLHWAVGVMPTR